MEKKLISQQKEDSWACFGTLSILGVKCRSILVPSAGLKENDEKPPK